SERAVDLVGRDMQKSERGSPLCLELAPVAQRFLKQRECSDHVGLDEFSRTVNRAIDVAFRCQVHHRIRSVPVKKGAQVSAVANVDLCESVTWVARGLRDRSEVRRIGELVNDDDECGGIAQKVPHEGGPDETCPSGHKDGQTLEPHESAAYL